MADSLDSVRVLSEPELRDVLNLSERIWDRMKRGGDAPPRTQLSERRVGYRVCDVKEWLDARRQNGGRAA
jgi:predicted DNA-binding transcriptional regulator AlpA